MKTATWMAVAISALVMVGCGSAGGATAVSSAAVVVEPILLPGAPTCAMAAEELGLTGPFTQKIIYQPCTETYPYALDELGNTATITCTTPAKVFDWTATLGIDFIVVRAISNPSSHVYVYDPEATSGTGLTAPPMMAEGDDDRIAYVKFCFDYEEEAGCTLTQGYWKTHSKYGPAPLDETWALLGEDTAFFLSGKSYFEVLQTPPRGNPYYILAKQFIAAKLNGLAGASLDDVDQAMTDAEALFESTEPGEARAIADRFLRLAVQLTDYNEGETGPGHCDGAAGEE